MSNLQVVLASPSDLEEERKMIEDLVRECNSQYIKAGMPIDLRMWENSLPGSNEKGAQGLIDLDLEIPSADIFICMFWKKIGTVLEGENVAGTEHELDIAIDSNKKRKKPDIKVFFKRVTNDSEANADTKEIDRIAEKVKPLGLYNVFNDKVDLEKTIRHIFEEEYIKRLNNKFAQNSKKNGITVVNETSELVNNLKPQSKIILNGGYYGILDFDQETEYVRKENVFDGQEVVIDGLSDVTINGNDAVVLTGSRYANVIKFINCKNIKLESITLGHTPQKGFCIGSVLCFEDCTNVELVNVEMFGCGTYGIYSVNTSNLHVRGSKIFDCSIGGIFVSATEITVENSKIYDCRDVYSLVFGINNSTVMLDNVSIYDNIVSGCLINVEDSAIICRGVSVYNNKVNTISNVDINYGLCTDDNFN